MEETYSELVTWLTSEEKVKDNIKEKYQEALGQLKALLPFEDALVGQIVSSRSTVPRGHCSR